MLHINCWYEFAQVRQSKAGGAVETAVFLGRQQRDPTVNCSRIAVVVVLRSDGEKEDLNSRRDHSHLPSVSCLQALQALAAYNNDDNRCEVLAKILHISFYIKMSTQEMTTTNGM